MLNSTVLLFGNDDTSIALVDDSSRQRLVLNAATTIELSIQFPLVAVNRNTWWHILRSDLDKFFEWWFNESDGYPTIIVNLDAWWHAVIYYSAWPTFEMLCEHALAVDMAESVSSGSPDSLVAATATNSATKEQEAKEKEAKEKEAKEK